MLLPRRLGALAIARDEDRVDAARAPEPALEQLQRHVGVLRHLLAGAHVEPGGPAVLRLDHAADDHPGTLDGAALRAQQAIARDVVLARQVEQHGVARRDPERIGQRAVEHDLVLVGVRRRPTGLVPEPAATAEDVDAGGPGVALRVGAGEGPFEQDGRHGGEALGEHRGGGHFVGQLGPKEAVAQDHLVDRPQALEGQVAQAPPHRVAHQQRPAEHRRAGRHAQGHGEVRSPVIEQRAEDEAEGRHGEKGMMNEE